MVTQIPQTAVKSKIFTRRAVVVGGFQALGIAGLCSRLAWLQLVQGTRYKTLSENNRINLKMLAPVRGQVLDRLGIPMATSKQSFRVLVVPEQTTDLEQSLRKLQNLIALEEKHVQGVLKKAGKSPKFVPLEIKNSLTWEEVSAIEVNIPDLPGLSIDTGEVRFYPFGPATAHIIGYVGLPGQADLAEDKVMTLPGFKIGKTGIEKFYDRQLRGQTGTAQIEVNVVGREVRELSRQKSISGHDLALSIDIDLQQYMQQRLAADRSASAVLMDAHTGAIYGLASYPSFDPNMFTHGIPAEKWEELLADPGLPLTNKAIAGQYPPASTFKMITGLAGLEVGKINRNRRVFCPGHFDYGTDRFHCWKKEGHGSVDLVGALAGSCDTFFYQIASEIGIDAIANVARRFGLGKKMGIDVTGENPGLVPDKAWKQAYHGKSWHHGETIVAAIGQGYLQATPLQLAAMTARLVNGGFAVRPWLTGYVGPRHVTQDTWPDMKVKPEHLAYIKEGMDAVVNDMRGTAYGSRIQEPMMEMGGKTGTAQVQRITKQQRAAGVKNESLPWKQRHHALFTGYAPAANPRYVCSVVVEHGVGGSSSAAPMARDILLEAQRSDPASRKIHFSKV